MIGDLVEWEHFHNSNSAKWIMQGFIKGFSAMTDEMAFRIAIHAGVHLLNWYKRRHPEAPLKGSPAQIASAVNMGTNFIVKGHKKDRCWFEKSILAPLFTRKPQEQTHLH